MEFIKKELENNFDIKLINELSKEFNLCEDTIKLLFLRGLDSKDKIEKYLSSGITQLNNPMLLKNMDKVVEKIRYYLENNKRILIMGDYDTDGISASAILYKYFSSIGNTPNVFLPNRFVDGYGLTIDSINKVKSLYNPDLIITVDCGITSVDEISYCKEIGIDIIVTDHHDIPAILPNTLIINPKLEDQIYPFKELCGAGVALKLVQALAGLDEAIKYTTIASIATVADIVPLIDENRAIVKLGLERQSQELPKGLKKLCSKLGLPKQLSSTDISFRLAPKLNATGRMGDAIISFNLYIEEENESIEKNISLLLELNEKRVVETNNIFESACQMLEDTNVSRLGMIVLYNDDWESGVLGIICSKLVEKYNRPVCLLSLVDGEYKGSCRSIPGINIFEVLSSVSDLLIRFGGHNQAGGLSIEKKNIKEFRNRVNNFVLNNIDENALITKKYYDLDITNKDISIEFIKELQIFEPCGFKNEKPSFRLQLTNATISRMSNHSQHIRIKSDKLTFIGFGKGEYYYNLNVNCVREIIVDLNLEIYANKERIIGYIKNINYSNIGTSIRSDILSANYLSQVKFIGSDNIGGDVKKLSYDDCIQRIQSLCKKSKFGTAILTYNMETYTKLVKTLKVIKNYELYSIHNACGENVIVLSPNSDLLQLKDYNNIFVLDGVLCDGYLSYLKTKFNNIYVVDMKADQKLLAGLSSDREAFGKIHKLIQNNALIEMPDIITYFNDLKRKNYMNKNLKFNQFMFFIYVMEELGICIFEDGILKFTQVKSNLSNSKIYNYIKDILNN